MALWLIYQVFTKLLGWIALRTRSDTCGCPNMCTEPVTCRFVYVMSPGE